MNSPAHLSNQQLQSVRPTSAVLISAAIGIALSYVILFIFGLIFLWVLVVQGVPANQSYARAYESTSYIVFAHGVGFLCLLPGGLWTAKLSSSLPIRNAAVAGVLVAVFAAIGNLIPYDLPIPFWSRIASILLPVPAFICGALLQHRGS
jgi:hypothetical protein